jgi:hypothetical protein
MSVETYGDEDIGTLRDSLAKSRFFKFQDGENKIRIVRWKNKDGKLRTACKRTEHFVPGAGTPIVCKGKGCEICEKSARLVSSGDKANQETGRRMRATDRVYFNLIDRKNEIAGVQAVAFPPGLAKTILGILSDPDYNKDVDGKIVPGLMLDPDEGRDFKIIRLMEDKQTKYQTFPAPNPSSVTVGETIDLETYLTRDVSATKNQPPKAEPAAAAKPSCYQDGESFSDKSEMCKGCDHKETCDTKGI